MAADARPFAAAALAFATFFAADEVGASGFIAAFVAGLVAARALGEHRRSLVQFSERDGTLLSFAVFFAFGILAAGVLDDITPAEALYAVLSLTVVRMVPVALALAHSGLRPPSLAFMGWFGPRGIATIALLLVAVGDEPDLAGLDVVVRTVTATVLLSIALHGVSAPALVRRYGTWATTLPAGAAETAEPADGMPS
jgi:NhaP-type Na+/H+ or K+/H+ antiporter